MARLQRLLHRYGIDLVRTVAQTLAFFIVVGIAGARPADIYFGALIVNGS